MKRWSQAFALLSALTLAACHGLDAPSGDPAEVRKQKEVELARLGEQVKSYDLLNSITTDPETPIDKSREAKRQEIDARLAQLRSEIER